MREKRDQLKEMFKDLQDEARPKKSPEEIALQAYKARTKNRIVELEGKLKNKDYSKTPKRTLTLDPEAMKLKADSERLKNNINEEVWKLKIANQTDLEKGLHFIAKWRRFVILSSVKTVGKLTAAATMRQITTPIEELAAGVLSQIPGVSKIAAKAPRYGGGMSIDAEVKAFSQWFDKQTWQDVKDVAKTGKGQLDILYGGKHDLPPEALDFFGHLHGALKVTPKRAEFFRSLEKRAQWAIKNGMDISDPQVQMALASDAYLDSNKAIFMNKNAITDAYALLTRYIESKAGTSGKIMTTGLKVLLPIVRVPTNFAIETAEWAFGAPRGAIEVISTLVKKDALKDLKPEDADRIMRILTRGMIGVGILAIGYYAADSIGGYYQYGEKRKGTDLKPGDLQIGGVKIPHFLLHTPAIEVLQMGATIRRVQDSYAAKLKGGGTLAGVAAAGKGVAEHIPFLEEPSRMGKALRDIEGASKFAAELGTSMVVPPDVTNVARLLDTEEGEEIKRKPETAADVVKLKVPGLRDQVPRNVKVEKQIARDKAAEGNAGKMLSNAVKEHKITEIEKNAISATAKGDADETGRLINMVSSANRMELRDLAKGIQDKATDDEKRLLKPIFRNKIMKKAGSKEISEDDKKKYFEILKDM